MKKPLRQYGTHDIKRIVDEYPWYAPAIKELAIRLHESGEELKEPDKRAMALSFPKRNILYEIARGYYRETSRAIDLDLNFETGYSSPFTTAIKEKEEPAVIPSDNRAGAYIAGGDYFNQSELEAANAEMGRDKSLVVREEFNDALTVDLEASDNFDDAKFYTETLAEIYVEQELYDRAIDVYSKLILLYPKKSAYFASLIDKLKTKIN